MTTTYFPRRALLITLAFGATVAAASVFAAEPPSSYPSKPIRLVVPFPAGQGADASARAIARELEALSGQPVIVDNRPGGNNVIGVRVVTGAAPDGYTLFYGTNSPMAANGVFFKNLGYDPVSDFAPVARLGRSPWVIVVSASSPIKSFDELVAQSKRDPTSVSFGTGATGYQLATILLAKTSGMIANIVPYKGSPQVIQDVVGQQVTATMTDYGTLRPLIESGRLRPLLVFDNERIATLPNVPMLRDVGLDVPLLYSWTAIFAPARTPSAVVDKLAGYLEKAVQRPTYTEFVNKIGSQTSFMGPAELGTFQRREVDGYRKAMRVGNVEPQ